MALETLEGVKEIDGYKVKKVTTYSQMGFHEYIFINFETNEITFRLQDGPREIVGENGCQVDTIAHTLVKIIDGLNEKFPCRENSLTITKLQEAIHWLDHRTKDRTKRGVEGLDEK